MGGIEEWGGRRRGENVGWWWWNNSSGGHGCFWLILVGRKWEEDWLIWVSEWVYLAKTQVAICFLFFCSNKWQFVLLLFTLLLVRGEWRGSVWLAKKNSDTILLDIIFLIKSDKMFCVKKLLQFYNNGPFFSLLKE